MRSERKVNERSSRRTLALHLSLLTSHRLPFRRSGGRRPESRSAPRGSTPVDSATSRPTCSVYSSQLFLISSSNSSFRLPSRSPSCRLPGMVDHHVGDERAGQPPGLERRVLGEKRIGRARPAAGGRRAGGAGGTGRGAAGLGAAGGAAAGADAAGRTGDAGPAGADRGAGRRWGTSRRPRRGWPDAGAPRAGRRGTGGAAGVPRR